MIWMKDDVVGSEDYEDKEDRKWLILKKNKIVVLREPKFTSTYVGYQNLNLKGECLYL